MDIWFPFNGVPGFIPAVVTEVPARPKNLGFDDENKCQVENELHEHCIWSPEHPDRKHLYPSDLEKMIASVDSDVHRHLRRKNDFLTVWLRKYFGLEKLPKDDSDS